jgi:Anti-anti-sigma regulatory factor (antagonist of anti-sigma factor)
VAQILGSLSAISDVLAANETAFLQDWVRDILSSKRKSISITEVELKQQCETFLHQFKKGLDAGGARNSLHPSWDGLRELLAEISKSRAVQGFNSTDVAGFIFSFKEPLFKRLREALHEPDVLVAQIWEATELLDSFALYSTELWLQTREDVIRRQREEMLELSTPVVKLWNNIVALPLVGTLDSARTQVVMETLLEAIVETNSKVAIIDITGVPTVDTVVAQHLLKTVTAARLMGAECIISGVRPQIAQTIVHLGINLLDVTTKATLRDALALALEKTGQVFTAAPRRSLQA